MEDDEASKAFLASLLNKNLRITTTDTRMFWGQFKCTDPDRNIVLASAYEYRRPTEAQIQEHAKKVLAGQASSTYLDMSSRYLGLVVVPGEHIVKIEVEEFASQMRSEHMSPVTLSAGVV